MLCRHSDLGTIAAGVVASANQLDLSIVMSLYLTSCVLFSLLGGLISKNKSSISFLAEISLSIVLSMCLTADLVVAGGGDSYNVLRQWVYSPSMSGFGGIQRRECGV